MIEYLSKLVRGADLSESEAGQAMQLIMRDEATASQIAGFIVALRVKGETVDEIAGLARTMRELATPISVPAPAELLATCGTGAVPRGAVGGGAVLDVLGSLCNPGGARRQALGGSEAALVPRMADTRVRLGVERAIVFHADGLDELSTSGPSEVIELFDGRRRE